MPQPAGLTNRLPLGLARFTLSIRTVSEHTMRLYGENNPAPNPRKVRIFLAEKGIAVEQVRVPIMKRAHKEPAFLKKNSLGQLPVLELDDGTCISESVAICRYFEELHPTPSLFGHTALERAQVEMWLRRAEFRR